MTAQNGLTAETIELTDLPAVQLSATLQIPIASRKNLNLILTMAETRAGVNVVVTRLAGGQQWNVIVIADSDDPAIALVDLTDFMQAATQQI